MNLETLVYFCVGVIIGMALAMYLCSIFSAAIKIRERRRRSGNMNLPEVEDVEDFFKRCRDYRERTRMKELN